MRPPTERSPGAPKVGAVILNYNGKALAERCVRSLIDSGYANLHIFLVDNASTDGSAEYLRSLFPGIHILECAKNLGITGGRNRGLREAVSGGCDYVLSLDNDAYVEARLIDELIAVAEADPRIGVVGPKVYLDDGSGRLQCAGGRITYTQNVSSERGGGEYDRGQYDKVEAVGYFPGFGFMARGEVFERLHFLDDRLSGWGHDDTDFCLRAAQSGYGVVYVRRPSASTRRKRNTWKRSTRYTWSANTEPSRIVSSTRSSPAPGCCTPSWCRHPGATTGLCSRRLAGCGLGFESPSRDTGRS